MNYSISYFGGHVEVFDQSGNFLFSADNKQEAMEELRELAA